MEKIAVFPGSFDPFTIGHESIVNRSLPLFDKIFIAVGYNTSKMGLFRIEDRMEWIQRVFANESKIEVQKYTGLTVDFCKKVNAQYLLRGLRTASDFEFERAIGQVNKKMSPGIETIFLLTSPEHTPVKSTIVRDIIMNGGDASQFLPNGIRITFNDYLKALNKK